MQSLNRKKQICENINRNEKNNMEKVRSFNPNEM